ncbi:MAG: DUF1499 domain-containing protein [Pseudomonadota bacterium]
MTTLLVIICLIAVLGAAFVIVGRERSFEMMAGSADLGAVPIASLKQSKRTNHALACPPEHCTDRRPDIASPIYALSVGELRDKLKTQLDKEALLEPVGHTDNPLSDRYVQRSYWFRFPDTIQIDYIPLGDNSSTIAIYSRSQLGRKDFGVNLARIQRWLGHIADAEE